jgi:arabinogalactan oligomer/maltooligosaccharide transport system permease protein
VNKIENLKQNKKSESIQKAKSFPEARKIALFSLLPGLGQVKNKQYIKAGVFFAVFIAFIVEFSTTGSIYMRRFSTLGKTPMWDNSLTILIQGSMQIIVFLVFAIFYYANIRDAHTNAKWESQGIEIARTPKQFFKSIITKGFPYLLSLPAFLLMLFCIILPVIITFGITFTNYDFNHTPPGKLFSWVGVKNFTSIFTEPLFRNDFIAVFQWTIIWTIVATTIQIVLGIIVALIANQPFIKAKRIWGVLFLLPMAVPGFITIMGYSNFFSDSSGAMNIQVIGGFNNILNFLHIPAHIPMINWLTDPTCTKAALVFIQVWLAFPYIFILITGILASIPGELYEAARIDGAGAFQRFKAITLPSILYIGAPLFILQYTGNFNNFGVIYLFNGGGPGTISGGTAGSTDILISWIYKLITGNQQRYGFAAAISLFIAMIIIAISMMVFTRSKSFQFED